MSFLLTAWEEGIRLGSNRPAVVAGRARIGNGGLYILAIYRNVKRVLVLLAYTFTLSLTWPSLGTAQEAEPEGDASFSLHDNERVVLLGNGYFEREAESGYLETLLTSRYYDQGITFRTLGWAGDTVNVQLRPRNFPTLRQSVNDQHPDVAFVMYGMNEAFAGEAGLEPFREGYESFLDLLGRGAGSRVVLLSPTQHFVNESPVPDAKELNASVGLYAEVVRRVAASRGIPFANLYKAVGARDSAGPRSSADANDATDLKLSSDGIHLSDLGYWLAGIAVEQELGLATPTWTVAINGEKIDASGTTISDVQVEEGGISFVTKDARLPLPVPPVSTSSDDNEVPQLARGIWATRRLQIIGLSAGKYVLRVDGTLVVSASAAAWAEGVVLTTGPEFDQVEALRELIVAKNRLFFYIWRAHNGEYSIGRRSDADRESEAARFEYKGHFKDDNEALETMIEEHEQEIATLATPAQHKYELSRQRTE